VDGESITCEVIATTTGGGDRDGTRTKGDTMSVTTTVSTTRTRGEGGLIRWILLDAAMSGASGLVLAAGAPWLDGLLGAPTALLVPLGLFLAAYAGGLVLVARRGAPTPAVLAIVVGNALWVVASVAVVIADWLTLTTTGTVLALAQAAAVALVADLQALGLRRRLS
jgi:hypothetical protein